MTELQLNKSTAAAALTPPARQLHQWVLAAFAETGHTPGRDALDRAAIDCGTDQAVTELITHDVLALDEQGEIRAAYPFSPTPTSHVLRWAGGPTAYAMCAIDALGMSAMLDRPVTITSIEPGTGATITVDVDRDRAQWTPDTAVVLAGATDDTCCPSVDRTCGHINFFTSSRAAQAWQAAHPHITGVVLDQTQALACGVAEFGALMRAGRT